MQTRESLSRRGLLLSLGGLAAVAVPAQQHGGMQGGRGGMMERRLEAMKERLKLSDEQLEKVRAVYKEQFAKMRELREKAMESGDRSAMRAEMRKLREETDAKILELLDDTQKAEYKKMQEEMREKMRQRRGGGPPH